MGNEANIDTSSNDIWAGADNYEDWGNIPAAVVP
jgi:hypothetical protein